MNKKHCNHINEYINMKIIQYNYKRKKTNNKLTVM